MPLALLAAFASSLAIHAAALFLPEVDLSTAPEPLVLQAEIQIHKAPTVVEKPTEPKKQPPNNPHKGKSKETLARSSNQSGSKWKAAAALLLAGCSQSV